MPKLVYNLLSNMLCSTMSKAELRSIETKEKVRRKQKDEILIISLTEVFSAGVQDNPMTEH